MRWSRTVYLLVWAALTVAQWFAMQAGSTGAIAAGLVGLQIAKAFAAVPRLNSQGRPADDALLALVPLGNIRLFTEVVAADPGPLVVQQRRAAWEGETSAFGLYWKGLLSIVKRPSALAFIVLVFGALQVVAEQGALRLGQMPATMDDGGVVVGQALGGVTAFLVFYLLVQMSRSVKVTRTSWWPTLLIVTIGCMAATVLFGGVPALPEGGMDLGALFGGGGSPQDSLVTITLASMASWLAWRLFVGSMVAVWLVDIVKADHTGETRTTGETISRVAKRWLDIAAPHGGSVLLVTLGGLLVAPGIIYACQLGFIDAVAVEEPEKGAFLESTVTTRGRRRRIFKVYLIGFVLGLTVAMGAAMAVETATGGQDGGLVVLGILAVIPPVLTGVSLPALGVGFAMSTLGMCAAYAGLNHMYFERLDVVAAAESSA